MRKWDLLRHDGCFFKYSPPLGPATAPPLFLFHGWKGNENSLLHLVQNVESNRPIFSLRGNKELSTEEFGWVDTNLLTIEDYLPTIKDIFSCMRSVLEFMQITSSKMDMLGFSQGAAISGSIALCYPESFRRVALISGYLPTINESSFHPDLCNTSFFIAHGIEDDVIPVEYAEIAKQTLESFNAEVILCKTNTRHKIGVHCLDQIVSFLNTD